MKPNIMERILQDLLTYDLGLDDVSLEKHLADVNTATKERVATLDDLQVIIYSNDHNPPTFMLKLISWSLFRAQLGMLTPSWHNVSV
jgi:hypothetical protein